MEKLDAAIVDGNPLVLDAPDELINTEGGLSVIGKTDNGANAVSMIVDTASNIVLLDLVMLKVDGVSVVEKVKSEHTFLKNPTFITLSTMSGEQMTEDVFKAGANYYLMKPSDKEIPVNKVRHIGRLPDKRPAGKILTVPSEPEEESHITREEYIKEYLETDITKMLHELGIPAHAKGCQYLRDAIAMLMEGQEMMNSVTKIPYSVITKRNQITASRVERVIRHVIKMAWDRDKTETIDGVFSYTTSIGKGKPTNSEFVVLISDKIFLKCKKI